MAIKNSSLLFLVVLASAFLIYLPGLSGAFVFDDYPQIVINENIRSFSSLQDVLRVGLSGNAGPGGRPLSLFTFAAQIELFGLDPFWFKLFNVFLHLLNACLIYSIYRSLLELIGGSGTGPQEGMYPLAVFSAAWWAFSPMAITAVLYVVQRMTSLSAMFTLVVVLVYIKLRRLSCKNFSANYFAFLAVIFGTAASYFSKESGVLTLLYVWLVEVFFLRFENMGRLWRPFYCLIRFFPLVFFCLLAAYIFFSPAVIDFSGRSYSMTDRVLTQARVLWFYICQILVPNSTLFGLYHDDIYISRSLFYPLSTLVAIISHCGVLGFSFFLRKRFPILVFGILWFYFGHILESTVFPLEMVFEHRNYLPMVGLIFGVSHFILSFKPGSYGPQVRNVLAALFLLLNATVTFATAKSWGDPLYAIHEAERKSLSSRANYDAGMKINLAIAEDREKYIDLYPSGKRYFDRSIAGDPDGIAAFVGYITLCVDSQLRPEEYYFNELIRRLSMNALHVNTVFSIKAIHDLMSQDSKYFTDQDAARIYDALLSNPKTGGLIKANALMAKGLLLNKLGSSKEAIGVLKESVAVMPHINEFRVIYIAALIDNKMFDEANLQLKSLEERNRFGLFDRQVNGFRMQLSDIGAR